MEDKRTIEGQWRIFGDRRRAYIGALTVDPEKGLELTVRATNNHGLAGALRYGTSAKFYGPETIRGLDTNNSAITLFGCGALQRKPAATIETHKIQPMAAVIGGRFQSWHEVVCSTMNVHYSLLDNWLLRPVADAEHEPGGNLAFKPRQHADRDIPLTDGASLTFKQGQTFEWDLQKVVIGQKHFIRFSFARPITLAEAKGRYAHPFRNFLTLMTNSKMFLDRITFSQEGQNPDETPMEFLSDNCGVEHTGRLSSTRLFVPYSEIEPQLAQIIPDWFGYYREMEPIISLYFAAIWSVGIPDTTQFLLLAQALEAYHNRSPLFTSAVQPKTEFHCRIKPMLDAAPDRATKMWLKQKLQHANQKTLAQRLNEVIRQHQSDVRRFIRNTSDFAGKIRHTRNYYTHFDEQLRRTGKVATGRELARLTIWMRALLAISFLHDLRVPQSAIDRLVSRVRGVRLTTLDYH